MTALRLAWCLFVCLFVGCAVTVGCRRTGLTGADAAVLAWPAGLVAAVALWCGTRGEEDDSCPS